MLSTVIQFLNAKFSTLPYINEVLGMGNIIEKDSEKFPAYQSNGEPVHVNFDTHSSSVLLFKNGKVQRDTVEHPYIANKEMVTETYPLRAVIYSQGLEDINCSSMAQAIAAGVKKNISGKQSQLKTAINAALVTIDVKDTDLDKEAVWKTLYSEESKLKETDSLIAIDFEVKIEGDEQCFSGEPCAAVGNVFYVSKIDEMNYDLIANEAQDFVFDATTQGFTPKDGIFLDLRNKVITEVKYDGIFLSPAYTPVPYTWSAAGGNMHFNITITDGVAIRITFKDL